MIRIMRFISCLIAAFAMFGLATIAFAGSVTYPPEAPLAHNMKLVGWHPIDGRPAYHPHIQQQGNKWILYVSEHVTVKDTTKTPPVTFGPFGNGTSILDVTNPAKPKLLAHLPGAAGVGGAQETNPATSPNSEARSMRVCERNGKFWMIRQLPAAGYEIYDVTNPANPLFVKHIFDLGQTNTHKINWECETDAKGRSVAYLPWRTNPSSSQPGVKDGWRGVYLKIYDLADPANPKFIRNYGRPGLEPGSEVLYPNAPSGVHHTGLDPQLPRKRVYVNYSCCSTGAFQILDRDALLDGNPNDMVGPSRGIWDAPTYLGVHSTYALPGLVNPELAEDKLTDQEKYRDYALVIGEAGGNGCNRQRQFTQMWDVTQDFKGWVVSGS